MSARGDPPLPSKLVEELVCRVARLLHVPEQDRDDLSQHLRLLWIRDGDRIRARQREASRHQGYMFKTLWRRGSNWCRAHTWREASREMALADMAAEPGCDENPEMQLLHSERATARQRTLEHALACLEPGARTLVELRFSSGLSVAEIARQLDLTPPVVSTRLWRALNTMRQAVAVARKEAQEDQRERERERERERAEGDNMSTAGKCLNRSNAARSLRAA